ncbi:MAG: SPOR domain-containing protein [Bacteroidales bacterium]|nr:SPOR domain-containing protein [Bacteroidales bacterium]
MRSCLLVLIFLLFSGTALRAQSGRTAREGGDILTRLLEEEMEGQVKVGVDSLLLANYYKFLTQNRKVQGIPGYRIRIYSESGIGSKEKQQRVRARFLSLYPDIDAYYRYDEPFFKVYVGDCRTRSEALKLYDRVKKNFPNPILVEDHINIIGLNSRSSER